MEWISVEDRLPEKDGRYLTIMKSDARAQHAKTWSGMGEPEPNYFCNDWDFKWNGRGGLTVAYWMDLPKFKMYWDKSIDGQTGKWRPEPPKESNNE